jgi:hypothetical protein
VTDTITVIRNLSIGIAIAVLIPAAVEVAIHIVHPRAEMEQYGHYTDHQWVWDNQAEYKKAENQHWMIYLYVYGIIGLVCLLTGMFIKVPFLATGFILAGIGCLCMGYIASWNILNRIIKLISLLISIALLIFIGFYFAAQERKNN